MTRVVLPDYGSDPEVWIDEEELTTESAGLGVSVFSFDCLGLLLWMFPVGRRLEAMVAECVGESLAAGLDEMESFQLASKVFSNRRVGICFGKAATAIRSGQSVHSALLATRPRVSPSLLQTVRVGEERGQLGVELHAFADRFSGGRVCQRLIRWSGRSKQAIQFAAALARLLNDHRLGPTVVNDAGKIAAAGDKRFLDVVASITEGMENGDSLAHTLHQFPQDFDPMFVKFVEIPKSREAFRCNLSMLAGN